MSYIYTQAVLDGPRSIRCGKLNVLNALAEWADDDGKSWYSVERIADRARLKVRACQYVLKRLESEGYITVEHTVGRGNSNVYIINLEALISVNGAISAPISEVEMVQKGAISGINGAKSDGEMVQKPTEMVQKPALNGAISLTRIKPPENHQEPSWDQPSRDARARKAKTLERFSIWFEECWLALPKAARVDKSDARIVAGDIQEEEWVGVLTAARNFALSDIVKRSMVWHASRFFREGNWKLYEDGPVFDSFALNGNGNGNGHTNGHGPPGESMFERAAEPPAGYSHDKTPDGRWRRMSRNSDTGLYPYDCDNLGDALGIERRMYGGKA